MISEQNNENNKKSIGHSSYNAVYESWLIISFLG